MRKLVIATFVLVTLIDAGCKKHTPKVEASTEAAPSASVSTVAAPSISAFSGVSADPDALGKSTLMIENASAAETTVYVAFGADSVVLPTAWPICVASAKLNCSFTLFSKASQNMPLKGKYLNATISFGAPVTCNTTKAELNLNNPKWYDTSDVSLVDGYSNEIEIDIKGSDGGKKLGPPVGKTGNEKVFGLFPLGCDICTARQSPPCGMSPGKTGCKSGTQYKPDVPCQYQGPTMGGGSAYRVVLAK
jgi:hypothetical protein